MSGRAGPIRSRKHQPVSRTDSQPYAWAGVLTEGEQFEGGAYSPGVSEDASEPVCPANRLLLPTLDKGTVSIGSGTAASNRSSS